MQISNSADQESQAAMLIEIVQIESVQIEKVEQQCSSGYSRLSCSADKQRCRSRKSSSNADRDSPDQVSADRESLAAVLIEIVEIEFQCR